jgi:site-specific recombinase XerD
VNAIRSEATKRGYLISLRRFMIHVKAQNTDELLKNKSDSRLIESQIIDYIMSLRNNGVAYSTIKSLVAPIFTFYQLNDVILNRKKIMRYTGEYKKVAKDKAYSTQQIQTALQNADSRMRMMLLILSSTSCRVGALPSLTLGNFKNL